MLNELNFKLPSSKQILIRESNGDDDAALSTLGDISTGDNFTNYISTTTVMDFSIGRKPMPEDINKWKQNDRYYFLLRQRIFNLGSTLEHLKVCSACKKEYDWLIELMDFETNIEEYSSLTPEAKGKYQLEKPEAILPYGNGDNPVVEFDAGNKKYRFQCLTTELDLSYQKKVPFEKRNKNSILFMRNLEVLKEGSWEKVTFFMDTPSSTMNIIRANILKWDAQWEPMEKFICPYCTNTEFISVMQLPDFYFPAVKI